jgi:hypothetical protein
VPHLPGTAYADSEGIKKIMGRKCIPVEPHIEKLEQALMLGATYELAAMYAGISVSTFERWRNRAADASPDTALGRLRDRLIQAEGRAAIGLLAKIEKAATDGNWQAAAWKLERRYPDQYGRKLQADLMLNIKALAGKVASELGLDVEVLMAEARALLTEGRDAADA